MKRVYRKKRIFSKLLKEGTKLDIKTLSVSHLNKTKYTRLKENSNLLE